MINRVLEVWIVTSRFDNKTANKKGWWWVPIKNQELFDIADKCGIIKESDDNCVGICVGKSNWKQKCEKLIK